MFLSRAARAYIPTDMAADLPRLFTRRGRPVADPVTEPAATESRCPCTNPDKKQFPVLYIDNILPGEFELPSYSWGC